MYLLDFETKSGTDIARGYNRYCSDPDADILCLVYGDEDADRPEEWWPGCGKYLDSDFVSHVRLGGLIGASNAPFDQSIWEYLATELYAFPQIAADQWYCTQAHSRVGGIPSKLEHAARALKTKWQKSRRGTALIQLMCIPPFEHTPELLAEMVKYCATDWYTMRDVFKATPLLTQGLFNDYQVNQIINERGVRVDVPLARGAAQYAEQERSEIAERLHYVTGGDVERPTCHKQFKTWLKGCLEEDGCDEAAKLMVRYKTDKDTGEKVKKFSSDKTVRYNMLIDPVAFGIDPTIVRALELMDDAGGSATSKYAKMALLADEDDRVRNAIRAFGAASTLRFSSIGLQLHNFRRDAFTLEDFQHYRRQVISGGKLTDPATGKPVRVMDTLGKMLRGAIIPAEGHVFVTGDWSAIESRMTAWLARDQNKLDVFLRGECPYCYAAEPIYGRPLTPEDDPDERQVGKVLDLIGCFLGGPGALAAMASSYRLHIPEDNRQTLVDDWRRRHPKIVDFGNLVFAQALAAMRDIGKWKMVDRGIGYFFDGSALYCQLPDGKTMLRYPDARVEMVPAPWDEDQMIPNITALKAAFQAKADADEWPRHALWRGLLLENIVQASCAILLREKVDALQHLVVFHVHDEIILEVPYRTSEDMSRRLQIEMETAPEWCADLPLVAEPKEMVVYGK